MYDIPVNTYFTGIFLSLFYYANKEDSVKHQFGIAMYEDFHTGICGGARIPSIVDADPNL